MKPSDSTLQESESLEQLVISPYYGFADSYAMFQCAAKEQLDNLSIPERDHELLQGFMRERRAYFWTSLPVSSTTALS